MRSDRIIPGLVLVLIGTLFLLNNFGHIHFHWFNIFRLWPIFLVIGGVNLIFAHNRSPWATILKIAVVIAGFALIAFGNFDRGNRWFPAYSYNFDNDNSDDDSDSTNNDNSDSSKNGGNNVVERANSFNQPYSADTHVARLNINGVGSYKLNDTTNQLFAADTKEYNGRYELLASKQDSVQVINFKMKNKNSWSFNGGKNSNSADIRLNTNPIWEINADAGATALNFDLSKFKIRELKISGGAGSYDVKMGQPLAVTNVEVSTGVSSVTINVPQSAACHITTSTGLSNDHFDGFSKKSDNTYETDNFQAAKNKLFIHMSGGISDFKVERY